MMEVAVLRCGIGARARAYQDDPLFQVRVTAESRTALSSIWMTNSPNVRHISGEVHEVKWSAVLEQTPIHWVDAAVGLRADEEHPFGLSRATQNLQHFYRLAHEIQPDVFIVWTPSSFQGGYGRLEINDWIFSMEDLGYGVVALPIDNRTYGIPVAREFIAWVALRKGGALSLDAWLNYLEAFEQPNLILQERLDEIDVGPQEEPGCIAIFPAGITYREVQNIIEEYELNLNPDLCRRDTAEGYLPWGVIHGRPLHPINDRYLTVAEALHIQGIGEMAISNGEAEWCWVMEDVSPQLVRLVSRFVCHHLEDVGVRSEAIARFSRFG